MCGITSPIQLIPPVIATAEDVNSVAQAIVISLNNLGVLGGTEPIYVDASELLSSYVSGSAAKVNEKLDEACQKNTVLVIEEAYQLLKNPDGIHALLNRMETDRRNFNLILILYNCSTEMLL